MGNQAHAISRRCSERRYFLVPCAFSEELVTYVLAAACESFPRVLLHAALFMSNHYQLVLTDQRTEAGQPSQLPAYFEFVDALIAKAMNTYLGRGESFWAPGSYRNVEIHGEEALYDQLVYALANPAAADLVETLSDWPGVYFGPERWGEDVPTAKPPDAFFGGRRDGLVPSDPSEQRRRRDRVREHRARDLEAVYRELREAGLSHEEARRAKAKRRKSRERERARERDRSTLPEAPTLRLVPPPAFEGREQEARERVAELLVHREAEHRSRRRREKKSVLGAAAVLAQSPYESAGSTLANYDFTPVIACKDRSQRRRVLKCYVGWERRYREVRKGWPKRRDEEFPYGTHQMVVQHGARVMSEATALSEGLIHAPTGPPASA